MLTVNYYDNYTFDVPGSLGSFITNSYRKTSTTSLKGLATGSKVKVLGTSKWVTSVSYYDEKGRPIRIYSDNNYLGSTDLVDSKLDDFSGRVLETTTLHTKSGNGLSTITTVDAFNYDHLGRLVSQTQEINSGAKEIITINEYNKLGQLKNKKVGGNAAAVANSSKGLQTVDYTYNIRGWLKGINGDTESDNDLFNFNIKYNDPISGTALFNGNISQTSWNTLNTDNSTKTYTYSYDALNRITGALSDTGGKYNLGGYDASGNLVSPITYDKNGNIRNLIRKGHTNLAATTFGTMDNLVYTYDGGNKLKKVLDNGNDTFGFKDGANATTEYIYDVNGNMTKDLNKGITNITYNHLNLPTRVTIGGKNIDYTYDAAGMKLSKTVEGVTTQYAGNYIYKDTGSGAELEFFNHAEGYVKPVFANGSAAISSFDYVYQYKDHLGNVRLSYTDNNNDGVIQTDGTNSEIVEESNYYPFGLKHKGYNNVVNGREHKYKYHGKEHQEELGLNWYDYGARNYQPDIGRWFNPDPLSDEFPDWSPYNFVKNNPSFYIDPTGLAPETIYENETTGKTVEVNDGIDKTIKVSDSNFQKAKFFANEINSNPDANGFTSIGVSQEMADGYTNFYNSVNSYDGFSLANLYDYAFNEPKLNVVGEVTGSAGALEAIGGPVVKSTGILFKGLKGLVNPKKTVVIGEDMVKRVIPYAKKNGYKYFKPRGKNPANWMKNQKQWIYRQVKDSKTEIINIGPKGAKPVSKYYKAELDAIKKIKRN